MTTLTVPNMKATDQVNLLDVIIVNSGVSDGRKMDVLACYYLLLYLHECTLS